jgi:hypothetical protein
VARGRFVPLATADQAVAASVVVENVTGVRPVTVAAAVFVPTVVPVMNFAAAFPLTSVITVAGVMLPPPAVTAKATLTPDFGLLEASVTCARMESEKLVPATTVVGSVPTLVTVVAAGILGAVEPPPPRGFSRFQFRAICTRNFAGACSAHSAEAELRRRREFPGERILFRSSKRWGLENNRRREPSSSPGQRAPLQRQDGDAFAQQHAPRQRDVIEHPEHHVELCAGQY